jgi:His-Xaa-Ser system protein HxsD
MKLLPMETQQFTFDLSIHSLVAIKKAAYRFTGDYSVNFSLHEKILTVTLSEVGQKKTQSLPLHQFPNEVLDQELREIVQFETKQAVELILAQAFSAVQLFDPVGEHADPNQDTLQIRTLPTKLREQ